MKRPISTTTALLGLALGATATDAFAFGQNSTPAGGSFAGSCSGYYLTGGFAQDGSAAGNVTTPYYTCAYQQSAAGGSSAGTSATTSLNGYPIVTFAAESATAGFIHLAAQDLSSSATGFSGSQAQAGWNESVVIPGPVGQTGVWQTSVFVDGVISSANGADSQASVVFLLNGNTISTGQAEADFVAANGPANVLYSFGYEMKPWRVDIDTPTVLNHAEVFMDIPFTYDVPFTLGIAGQVSAGSGSYGQYGGPNESDVDLGDTITWGGKGVVLTDGGTGSATSNFSVTNLSGTFDYNLPAVPEPSNWALMIVGFGLAGAALRASGKRRSAAPALHV